MSRPKPEMAYHHATQTTKGCTSATMVPPTKSAEDAFGQSHLVAYAVFHAKNIAAYHELTMRGFRNVFVHDADPFVETGCGWFWVHPNNIVEMAEEYFSKRPATADAEWVAVMPESAPDPEAAWRVAVTSATFFCSDYASYEAWKAAQTK